MNPELETAKLALRLRDAIAAGDTQAALEIEAIQAEVTALSERMKRLERRPQGGGGAQGIQGEPGPPGPPGPIAGSYFPNGW